MVRLENLGKILTTQTWAGAKPSFKTRLKYIKNKENSENINNRILSRKIIEPILWTKKYLIIKLASSFLLSIHIIKLIRFNSKASQEIKRLVLLNPRSTLKLTSVKPPREIKDRILLMAELGIKL